GDVQRVAAHVLDLHMDGGKSVEAVVFPRTELPGPSFEVEVGGGLTYPLVGDQEDLDLVLRTAPRAARNTSRFAGPVRSWQEGVGDDLVPGQTVMLQRLIEDQCLVGVQPALHLFLRRTEPFEFALPPLVLVFVGLEGFRMLLILFSVASTATVGGADA